MLVKRKAPTASTGTSRTKMPWRMMTRLSKRGSASIASSGVAIAQVTDLTVSNTKSVSPPSRRLHGASSASLVLAHDEALLETQDTTTSVAKKPRRAVCRFPKRPTSMLTSSHVEVVDLTAIPASALSEHRASSSLRSRRKRCSATVNPRVPQVENASNLHESDSDSYPSLSMSSKSSSPLSISSKSNTPLSSSSVSDSPLSSSSDNNSPLRSSSDSDSPLSSSIDSDSPLSDLSDSDYLPSSSSESDSPLSSSSESDSPLSSSSESDSPLSSSTDSDSSWSSCSDEPTLLETCLALKPARRTEKPTISRAPAATTARLARKGKVRSNHLYVPEMGSAAPFEH